MKYSPLFIALLFILSSCKTNYYVASDFEEQSEKHKTVAIAPSEYVIGTKSLSDGEFLDLYIEGSIVSALKSSPKNRNGKHFLSIFNPSLSVQKLESKEYSIQDSWTLERKELAGILAADALIVPRIYLEDGNKLNGKIEAASIKANFLILDGTDASLLYSIAETYEYKNMKQLERGINKSIKKFVRYMPYFS